MEKSESDRSIRSKGKKKVSIAVLKKYKLRKKFTEKSNANRKVSRKRESR